MKIDAVITWVDGSDPAHRAKRMRYASDSVNHDEDKGGETRFSSLGEIFWCVASLNRFAPWLHRIYIVTDNQDPGLTDFLNDNFPDGHIPVEIVDHKVIFRGYEEYLPTFNSISIETMTWRIPGLGDRYIEFNDDLLLASPVSPEDFFTPDGKVVCYGQWASIHMTRLTRLLKTSGKVTTKRSHLNGALLAGNKFRYLRLDHCQKALRRDFFENYFNAHTDLLKHNVSFRFRDVMQFTPQELMYVSLYDEGECEVRSSKGLFLFYHPRKRKTYFFRKLEALKRFKGKFLCLNSLDQATDEQRTAIKGYLSDLLGMPIR